MKRELKAKDENIRYSTNKIEINIYRNLIEKKVHFSLWIKDKGNIYDLSYENFLELYDLMKDVQVSDFEIKD